MAATPLILTLLGAALLSSGAPPSPAQAAGSPAAHNSQDITLDTVLDRAQTEQAAGQYAQAAADYAQATRLEPRVPELWANRGLVEYLAGQTAASITSLQRALALNPQLVAPLLFLGKAHLDQHQPERAIPLLERARTAHPNDPEILLTLAQAQQGAGRFAQAAATDGAVLALTPDRAAAWFSLGVSSLELIQSSGRALALHQAQSPWARALYADDLLAQGRANEATAIYREVLAAAKPAQLATLAAAAHYTEQHPEVFTLPPASETALHRIDADLAQAAVTAPPPACGNSPVSASPACSFLSGDFAASAAAADHALTASPDNPEALFWSVEANQLRASAALARFEELAPKSAPTFDLVGDLFRRQHRPDQAIAQYEQALSLDPHDPAAQLGIAAAALSLGDTGKAITTAKSALEARPDDLQLNLLVAQALVDQHNFAEAQPFLEKCAAAPPELAPEVHALRGRVFAETGDPARAVRELTLALPSDRDGSLHFQLSRLLRKSGDLAGAQKAEAAAKALVAHRIDNAATALSDTASTPTPPDPH